MKFALQPCYNYVTGDCHQWENEILRKQKRFLNKERNKFFITKNQAHTEFSSLHSLIYTELVIVSKKF